MALLVCPEEVDVFKIPHIRMKQIISQASEKMSTTNFQDNGSFYGLLSSFYNIFLELKHHEEVENSCIMKNLQGRLTDEQICAIVKDVHKHSHVREILSLIKKGFKNAKRKKTLLNMVNYESKLRRAVNEFEKDIFPHMKHEEEVFQPLLMEYFSFDELKTIKEKVVDLHTAFSKGSSPSVSSYIDNRYQESSSDSETGDNETLENVPSQISNTPRTNITKHEQSLLLGFPPEVTMKIFSYLSPKDLCHASQVCHSWSVITRDGQLWKTLYPVRWIFGNDWQFGEDVDDVCTCNCNSDTGGINTAYGFEAIGMRSSYADADADLDELDDSDDDADHNTMRKQLVRLLGFAKYLLPIVGKSVQVLKLGCCPLLSNGLVFKMLSQCPNIEHLDLSQTAVSDFGLKGLFRKGGGSRLKTFNVAGCKNITDKTLDKLSSALGEAIPSTDIEEGRCECTSTCGCAGGDQNNAVVGRRTLVYLSMSGCYQITDDGLRSLANKGGLPKLQSLDLSGCLNITACGLRDLVSVCPSLDHEHFYYCDNIDEGPYQDTASGCQNLECSNRVCCRLGE